MFLICLLKIFLKYFLILYFKIFEYNKLDFCLYKIAKLSERHLFLLISFANKIRFNFDLFCFFSLEIPICFFHLLKRIFALCLIETNNLIFSFILILGIISLTFIVSSSILLCFKFNLFFIIIGEEIFFFFEILIDLIEIALLDKGFV